jgi:hypothetical protein
MEKSIDHDGTRLLTLWRRVAVFIILAALVGAAFWIIFLIVILPFALEGASNAVGDFIGSVFRAVPEIAR